MHGLGPGWLRGHRCGCARIHDGLSGAQGRLTACRKSGARAGRLAGSWQAEARPQGLPYIDGHNGAPPDLARRHPALSHSTASRASIPAPR